VLTIKLAVLIVERPSLSPENFACILLFIVFIAHKDHASSHDKQLDFFFDA